MKPETLDEKVKRVLRDRIEVVPYDACWPLLFEEEKAYLLAMFPQDLIRRVEHFGSTSVPGLAAKPVIDMLIEVSSLERTKVEIAQVLERKGYDYFWRASHGEEVPPFYAWFIKRNGRGERTHHLHMVESHFEQWDRLLFRDYLRSHPEEAARYQELKLSLCRQYGDDRIAYTRAKTGFIVELTKRAQGRTQHAVRHM
ncbi:GrpB family protein [Pelobacter propionicus]|uniref:Glutamate-rich protein grpB n=1 Tax=Pelobacter propionicus (strain DSM 2379 / NBRC 103807 / OttBd1) TaxID=338966 RepID=A1AP29_PELPD|nr:GrpB family protein [Pelobacter propionicus]ABK99099.1 protein of unknown function UPF0157 [Pelobacter propionicus DSM 2379]